MSKNNQTSKKQQQKKQSTGGSSVPEHLKGMTKEERRQYYQKLREQQNPNQQKKKQQKKQKKQQPKKDQNTGGSNIPEHLKGMTKEERRQYYQKLREQQNPNQQKKKQQKKQKKQKQKQTNTGGSSVPEHLKGMTKEERRQYYQKLREQQNPNQQKKKQQKKQKKQQPKKDQNTGGSNIPEHLKRMTKEERRKYYQKLREVSGEGQESVIQNKNKKKKKQAQKPKKMTKEERKKYYEQLNKQKQEQKKNWNQNYQQGKQKEQTSQNNQQKKNEQTKQKEMQKNQTKPKKAQQLSDPRVRTLTSITSHISSFKRPTTKELGVEFSASVIHPLTIELSLKFSSGKIGGTTGRCIALLNLFKILIMEVTVRARFSEDVVKMLNRNIEYLIKHRQFSYTMFSVIRTVKEWVSRVDSLEIKDAKNKMCSQIDEFLRKHIYDAEEEITEIAWKKIKPGDVILVYANSRVIEKILKKAHENEIPFRVIVVDSRPMNEGKRLLKKLDNYGIKCSFCELNAISYIIKEVTKVFIGVAVILSNGSAVGRIGTAIVAMIAKRSRVPVIVCCPSFKLSKKVQLDSLVSNEHGDPQKVLTTKNSKSVKIQNLPSDMDVVCLLWDVTPINFISLVITEYGLLPPTSMQVLIREFKDF
ncbi:translation initiation factor eif-2b [Anaeramoeba flamelloides]|uniref:Translation initiation factor eIF2B subunit delta n=1 Tax=Anaeramoeba flamelloides TaxID=1746091 RepID=A0ABQ8X5F9_9EUKA|nr:translation initiation factor eif-2b [Anaeramoeba flamelloides]